MNDIWNTPEAFAAEMITTGQSGAEVYRLTDGSIAKRVRRAQLQDEEKWAAYIHEARFYAGMMAGRYPFLPEILHCEWTEAEIRIRMRGYTPLDRQQLTGAQLENIMETLSQVHALPLTDAVPQHPAQPQQLTDAEIAGCLEGWRTVLNEQNAAKGTVELEQIASEINALNRRHFSRRRCCCHGDFHFDNLLTDGRQIIVCDWQSVHAGHPAEDIAFFCSRLSADGCSADTAAAVQHYCRISGIDPQEVDAQMRLADLNTAFVFWHHFLHGAPAETFRTIWEKMVENAAALRAR